MVHASSAHTMLDVYRQRKPQDSAYYRCVEDCFETFEQVYQDRFEQKRYFLYDRKLLSDLSRCGWEALKAFYTNGVRDSKVVPGAVVAIQTFGLRLGDLRLGEGFSTRISSPPAYTGFRRLFPRKRYVFRFTHC